MYDHTSYQRALDLTQQELEWRFVSRQLADLTD
jgi:predicted RNA polymerase sigma factor